MNTSKIINFENPSEERAPTFSGEKEKEITWQDFCRSEGIGERFHNSKLSDVKGLYPDIFKQILNWAALSPRPNLVFNGSVGCGKTHAAIATLRTLWMNGNKWCRYLSAPKLIEMGDNRTGKGIAYIKEIFGECSFLLIDDLGVEKAAEWETKILFELLDRRYNARLTTIVTSNYDLDGLEKIYDKRIVSRLRGMEIEFPSGDLRRMF